MRHAVVFGGSNGGIGSALARELARSHRVVVVDLVPPRVELGNSIDFLQCNVAELGDVAKLVPQLSQLVSLPMQARRSPARRRIGVSPSTST